MMKAICFEIPQWVADYAETYQVCMDDECKMQFVLEAVRLNIQHNTGGPFAAAVFEQDTGKLISLGVNLVTTQHLSILHAEMVAISMAQRFLGTYALAEAGDYELVTSTEPCAMCLGAIPWSGIKRVVAGATDQDARNIGFDEGAKPVDWKKGLMDRNIQVVVKVEHEKAIKALQAYLQMGKLY